METAAGAACVKVHSNGEEGVKTMEASWRRQFIIDSSRIKIVKKRFSKELKSAYN